jgi:ADP-ribose pyrophosphatase YjhB (NUDIX family)
MQHRISAGAIVESDGRVLMVRHVREGLYDFWVCPGGGVKGIETLEAAAVREVKEETGLDIAVSQLLYFEEFHQPDCRHIKFWFKGHLVGGELDATQAEAVAEHIVQAAWLNRQTLQDQVTFPAVMSGRYWSDRESLPAVMTRLPLRQMEFW